MSFFGAPNFLAMPAVGLDISADALRFIELSEKGKFLSVSRFAKHNFPLGVIADGHVQDKKKLQGALASLAHEYKLSFANVSLPEEQAYLANMRLPRVDLREVRSAIEIHLEEYVPITSAEAIFDYALIDEPAGRHRDTIDVVVAALPRSIVDEYLDVFEGTGITPKAFEFESQAMARAIVPRGDNGTFLVVDVGKMLTDVFVVANGVVQFSASLDIGGHMLTQAIEHTLNVSYEEAEEMKVKYGLVSGAKERGLEEAMLPIIADLRMRLMQHYSYWQTHHTDKAGGNIEFMYLTGGGANLRGLSEYLSAGLDIKVDIANPWVNVASFEQYIPPLLMRDAHGYTAAIGLALRNNIPE